MKAINIYLDEHLQKEINILAMTTGKAKSQIVREALASGLKTVKPKPSKSAKILLQLAELKGEAPGNLAKQHNDYGW